MNRADMTEADDRTMHGRTGAAWMAGGALWLAAGIAGAGHHGWRFDAVEALWIAADLLLLAGLLGLRRIRPYRTSRAGDIGAGIAIAGRVIFLAAELVSVVQRNDENALLPLGALLSAVGMLVLGIAIARAGRWQGAPRFGPLVMGIYPFLVMFPLLVASGGDPPIAAITGWGVAAIIVGVAVLARAATVGDDHAMTARPPTTAQA